MRFAWERAESAREAKLAQTEGGKEAATRSRPIESRRIVSLIVNLLSAAVFVLTLVICSVLELAGKER